MDPSSVLSDDDYDVISNPGNKSLESSLEDFVRFEVRELPAADDAFDRFETTRWSAQEIQLYVQKGLNLTPPDANSTQPVTFEHKRVRVYVDGIFDAFGVGHALQLRQAKLAFPYVHLIVGVFSDDTLQQSDHVSSRPGVERAELVRHCRWTDEVLQDAPWEVTLQFLKDKAIDFVAIDEGTSIDPSCDKARVMAYDELRKHGKIVKTRRTLGLVSQQDRPQVSPSQRATPTLTGAGEAPDITVAC
ncbi:hypothetical protein GALMADRAFT_240841 [Galerina marginata CBS 339.88]|uniref:choline-phosphate cytidylyltransferase n=1 Tax=Galerina marginata (strain CBS 339.88) TaxID=685588 RepID=A0A067TNK5_GALM3|nr:hypothetical protein GALMADRAFT_240841 [Galerina marginata CBS 339.88]